MIHSLFCYRARVVRCSCQRKETYYFGNHRKESWSCWLHLSRLWLNTCPHWILLAVLELARISIGTRYLIKVIKWPDASLDNFITKGYCGRCENRTPSPTRGLLRDLDLTGSSVQFSNKGHKICCAASYCEYIFRSCETRIKFDVHRNHQAISIRFSSWKT